MKTRTLPFVPGLTLLLMIAIMGRSETWSSPTWMTELNSGSRDLEPWISADSKTMYFSSDRTGSLELYVTHQENGAWAEPIRLPQPVNDPRARDGHASLTLDGRYLFFHSNRPSPYNNGSYGWRACDIWVSENVGGQWAPPTVLGPAINSTMMDYAPCIANDGRILIFASDRPGGYGQHDLYIAYNAKGEWGQAENMGPPINTGANQVHPSLSYTGRYLFFSDLSYVFRSELVDGFWQAPVRLPSTVNDCPSGTESSVFNECTHTLYYYKTCGPTGSWDMATARWLDPPDDNPCDDMDIPESQWHVRATPVQSQRQSVR